MNAPDLYQYFGLDRQENCTALGVLLSGKEAQLSMQGVSMEDPRRREASTAYAVLGDEGRRKLYDEAVAQGRTITWAQLDYLGSFDNWPPEYAGWTEPDRDTLSQQQTQQTRQSAPSPHGQYPHSQYQQPASPYNNPFDPLLDPRMNAAYPVLGYPTGVVNYAAQSSRPTADKRAGMAIADFFLGSMVMGMVSVPFMEVADGLLGTIIWTLLMAAYMIVPEVKWGASPVKLMAGYEVRNVQTGQRLTWAESAKRNWFRLAPVVPGLGHLVSCIGALTVLSSINSENGLRGSHDRFAGAEVVKKQ